jgi:hypothetical protein
MAGLAPATLRVTGDNPLSIDPPEFLNLVSPYVDKNELGICLNQLGDCHHVKIGVGEVTRTPNNPEFGDPRLRLLIMYHKGSQEVNR